MIYVERSLVTIITASIIVTIVEDQVREMVWQILSHLFSVVLNCISHFKYKYFGLTVYLNVITCVWCHNVIISYKILFTCEYVFVSVQGRKGGECICPSGFYTSHAFEILRFALLWESQNIIAVSTAIQDWLKSSKLLDL